MRHITISRNMYYWEEDDEVSTDYSLSDDA